MTLDSTVLLYTYISRFSVNPHYRQQLYLRPSFIVFFSFFHKWPTFAFTSESGYTLGFRRKIAHKGTHGETGGVLGGGWYHYPRSVPHVSETLRGRVSEWRTLPLFSLGRRRSRRRRGPAGLRRPTPPAERTVLAPISPRVQLCLRRPAFPLSAFIPGA